MNVLVRSRRPRDERRVMASSIQEQSSYVVELKTFHERLKQRHLLRRRHTLERDRSVSAVDQREGSRARR